VTETSHITDFIDFDSGTDECQTGVAQFPHAVCHHQRLTKRRSLAVVRTRRFARSFFLVAANAYTLGYSILKRG